MLTALLLQAAPTIPASAIAFTWVDGIKIVLIPLVLFILQRIFNRSDKLSDEQRGKKEAEAKAEKQHVKDELKRLSDLANVFVSSDVLTKRFEAIEQIQAKQDRRQEGFQQQHERLADETKRRCDAIETQLGQVAQLREDMAGVKAELKGYGRSIDDMKVMLQKLLDLQLQ